MQFWYKYNMNCNPDVRKIKNTKFATFGWTEETIHFLPQKKILLYTIYIHTN